MHGAHYSRNRTLRRFALSSLLLALCGCQAPPIHPGEIQLPPPGFLGTLIDRPPPPVTLTTGEPTGVLLEGTTAPVLPDAAVDDVVGERLRDWMTFEERRTLALASQQAAIAPIGAAIRWRAADGAGSVTATGQAMAAAEVYRSLRGRICRDVRESFTKDGKSHDEQVRLCRRQDGPGPALWVLATAD